MKFHFTKHARQKFLRMEKAGFTISQKQVKQSVFHPLKVEDRQDATYIAMTLIDNHHVLRVVYRTESDIIIIITFYPGRRKAYEI